MIILPFADVGGLLPIASAEKNGLMTSMQALKLPSSYYGASVYALKFPKDFCGFVIGASGHVSSDVSVYYIHYTVILRMTATRNSLSFYKDGEGRFYVTRTWSNTPPFQIIPASSKTSMEIYKGDGSELTKIETINP